MIIVRCSSSAALALDRLSSSHSTSSDCDLIHVHIVNSFSLGPTHAGPVSSAKNLCFSSTLSAVYFTFMSCTSNLFVIVRPAMACLSGQFKARAEFYFLKHFVPYQKSHNMTGAGVCGQARVRTNRGLESACERIFRIFIRRYAIVSVVSARTIVAYNIQPIKSHSKSPRIANFYHTSRVFVSLRAKLYAPPRLVVS